MVIFEMFFSRHQNIHVVIGSNLRKKKQEKKTKKNKHFVFNLYSKVLTTFPRVLVFDVGFCIIHVRG